MSEVIEQQPPISDKKAAYIAKRKHLIELSKVIRAAQSMDEMGGSINEGLKEIYLQEGHEELNTFHQWLKLGKQVRKGEKALLLWGRPKETQQGEDDEDSSTKFWPLCYVFSNLQVKER